jgi:hypothetical protein
MHDGMLLADRAAAQCHRQAFQADATAWTLQPMLGFVRSLRGVAEAADAGLAKAGRRPERLADCLDKLRKLFQAAQQASGDRRRPSSSRSTACVASRGSCCGREPGCGRGPGWRCQASIVRSSLPWCLEAYHPATTFSICQLRWRSVPASQATRPRSWRPWIW